MTYLVYMCNTLQHECIITLNCYTYFNLSNFLSQAISYYAKLKHDTQAEEAQYHIWLPAVSMDTFVYAPPEILLGLTFPCKHRISSLSQGGCYFILHMYAPIPQCMQVLQ